MKNAGMVLGFCLSLVLASFAEAGSSASWEHSLTESQFVSRNSAENGIGKQLVDIEVRWDGSEMRFSGIWAPVDGTVVWWAAGNAVAWDAFVADFVTGEDGRWLDFDVEVINGTKVFSGCFLIDGDSYAWEIRPTHTDAEFQARLDAKSLQGMQIIDFEAYVEDGSTSFAGVWVNDPNQPRTVLYYGLTGTEFNDIFSPQLPIDPSSGLSPIAGISGRPIDVERYFSSLHNEIRYAVIFAMYPGSQWAAWVDLDESGFEQKILDHSDADTHLIDLETWENGGLRFSGLWGDTYKSLHEVSAIPAEEDLEPITPALQGLINQFEAQDAQGPLGIVGIYAKNIRTNQSVGYRHKEPFYLASCSKTTAHIKLWQDHEADRIDMNNDPSILYSKNPWYMSDKTNGLGQANFGSSYTLAQLDQFMMGPSDNAATSMLIELVLGRERLNHWLSGVSGIGRGFGPITGISELDRVIMWQGQVNNFPNDPSYFLIPSWIWEPQFRGAGDVFGDLQTWANNNNGGTIPNRSDSAGHQRYFRMGMNTAQPRSFGHLLEKFIDGDFFDLPGTLTSALNSMGTGSQFDDNLRDSTVVPLFPGFPPLPEPNSLTGYYKNGGKGGVSCNGTRYQVTNDTGIIQKGADTIVMVVFTKDNLGCASTCNPAIAGCRLTTATPPGNSIRSFFMARFGYELYSALMADLTDNDIASHGVSHNVVTPYDPWWVKCNVDNDRGGDALPYKIRFYASTDFVIDGDPPAPVGTGNDYLLGTFETPKNHPGNGTAGVVLNLDEFPADIPAGVYFVGWILDADDEIGEWDDRAVDNNILAGGLSSPISIVITPPSVVPDLTFDGYVGTADLRLLQACLDGPGEATGRGCIDTDFDDDLYTDLFDYSIFQNCYKGDGLFADPACDD